MSTEILLDPPGAETSIEDLVVPKARLFAEYLQKKGREAYAHLTQVRRIDGGTEVIVFEIEPERPQQLAHDIRRHERLAAVFSAADDTHPELLALRNDFPLVPHVNARTVEFPRSLCLYDQTYDAVRINWTPASFLKRIHHWFAQTAKGTLHGADQPLEPLILGTSDRVILPADFYTELRKKDRVLSINSRVDHESQTSYIAEWHVGEKQPISIAAAFMLSPQPHGILRNAPESLAELHNFCLSAKNNLVGLLQEKIRAWYLDKPAPKLLDAHLLIVLVLPKTREAGGIIETFELRTFLTGGTVQQVGIALGVIDRAGGGTGFLIGDQPIDEAALNQIGVEAIQTHIRLDSATAAMMNGVKSEEAKILAVGSGALGSQILNNFVRGGFGKWTVVDPDVFLPHNAARHLLSSKAVGFGKAFATASVINDAIGGDQIITPIAADMLKPGKYAEKIEQIQREVGLICDFSASVPVARSLARSSYQSRHVSAFVTPRGDGLVVTMEDSKRKVRLDWMEMLHYRAIINEPALKESLQSAESKLRYGNSCRDITTQIAQDDIAVWAGLACKTIRALKQSDKAAIKVFATDGDGAIQVYTPKISKIREFVFSNWKVRVDTAVIASASSFRKTKLPNETGGILIGSFDTHDRVCSIVDILPSPGDSVEWPTSYIRGNQGLRACVEEIEKQTLGQLTYVGEWHSHPKRCSVLPSCQDMEAYGWLCDHMNTDGLPAVMLIVGDRGAFSLAGLEPTIGV